MDTFCAPPMCGIYVYIHHYCERDGKKSFISKEDCVCVHVWRVWCVCVCVYISISFEVTEYSQQTNHIKNPYINTHTDISGSGENSGNDGHYMDLN